MSNWLQSFRLTGNDAQVGDYFGTAVSLNSAGNIALVGNNAGSAYIFTGSSSNWTEVAKITGSGLISNDYFGASVSLNSLGNVALVGAYQADPNGVDAAGAAYIFTGSGNNWVQATRITGSEGAASVNDYFGASVALNSAGNVALVGAPYGNQDAGLIYIYTGFGNNWVQTAKLSGSDTAFSDLFGITVDLNSEGNIAIIGSSDAAPNGVNNAGAAYIFTGS